MTISLLLTAAVLAGEAAPPAAWTAPDACRGAAAALCPGKTGEELRRCLEERRDRVAQACREAMDRDEEARAERRLRLRSMDPGRTEPASGALDPLPRPPFRD